MTFAAVVAGAAAAVSVAAWSGPTQQAPPPPPPPAAAQQPAPPPPPRATVPLRLMVVLERYEGVKKVSSLPFVLSLSTHERTSLRMGSDVPVPQTVVQAGEGVNVPVVPVTTSFQYRNVGTNIDATSTAVAGDRFSILLTVEDSQVFVEPPGTAQTWLSRAPRFRNFRSITPLILQDGQTIEFMAATDAINGEVVKIAVTLNVVK